jgi:3-deoxy-manno-octulosonate cytidylyltransferase (CMP-KDO synthetase)
MADAIGIIPARYASTRFPGKLLMELGGEPLIRHVVRNVQGATRVARAVLATDDERIAAAVEGTGVEIVQTRGTHATGTDRIGEAARRLGLLRLPMVLVQGDEPFLGPGAIDAALDALDVEEAWEIATLASPCGKGEESRSDVVKVAVGRDGRALYFSRAPIPWGDRDEVPRLRHIGIYAYRAGVLERILGLPRGRLEEIERLEQLRWLEAGFRVGVRVGEFSRLAIDTPADLERARKAWPAAG